ncbi:TPA: hypothetical protein QCX14_002371 [Bacillus toyonensis]|uniref:hypothetical protein n=1 Tax=Bacillus toyonensis TaxID=155322 RepID=UPI000BF5602A|nr:hypothetical protein [Bacillus toyonensis]PEP20868.1 hypothetical protein CN578_00060 [Bacillus toyonensis]HDR7412285.1 hypothetical protein [Bacillus toyonensis]HDR7499018.1 hypothetical protein [Bacillus toyonensis]
MDIVWSDIWGWVLSSAGGAGVATYFVKKGIESTLNKKLEEYKSELQRMNNNYQIVFSKLHGDRTETIKQLYNILFEIDRNVRNLKWEVERANIEGIREQTNKLMPKSTKFHTDYQVNRIYFSEDICKLFESMHEKLANVIVPIHTFYLQRFTASEEDLEREEEIKEEMRKYMDEDIPKLKGRIEEEFKRILGVDEK